jgi:AcrR family transcriptional regulator
MATSASKSARERVREEITREILDVARAHLAEHGPVALSLRAVARDVGMVSSAVYRYFPSRDDLLTALIVEAYGAVADEVEAAAAASTRRHLSGRWAAVTASVRDWARAHPHEYGLIYGTPVPGYQAPEATIEPVNRLAVVLVELLRDGLERGELTPEHDLALPKRVHAALAPVLEFADLPDDVVARGLLAWTSMFGAISYELFGHLHSAVLDYDAYFEHQMARLAHDVLGAR